MKKELFIIAIFCLASLLSCKNDAQQSASKAIELTSLTLKKNAGIDCQKPDSLRNNCLSIDLSWPSVKTGNVPLQKGVAAWAEKFLTGLLNPSQDSIAVIKLADAAQALVQSHGEWSKGNTDSPMGQWVAESTDSVLLNDGKHLTLNMKVYTYTGGAHGLSLSPVVTFDVATGKELTWKDLVTDEVAVKALAEKKFKQVRAELFKPESEGGSDFKFDETFQFQLPVNYGLTDKGIYCAYQLYEVTPYALGSTDFVLTFEELGALLKKM